MPIEMKKPSYLSLAPEAIIGLLVVFGLYLTSLYRFHLFHSLAELFSIVIGCGAFIVAWNTRRFSARYYEALVLLIAPFYLSKKKSHNLILPALGTVMVLFSITPSLDGQYCCLYLDLFFVSVFQIPYREVLRSYKYTEAPITMVECHHGT